MNLLKSFLSLLVFLVVSGCADMNAAAPQSASSDQAAASMPSSDGTAAVGADHGANHGAACGDAKAGGCGGCADKAACCGGKCDCKSEKCAMKMEKGCNQHDCHGDKGGCGDSKECKKACDTAKKCSGHQK